MNLPNFLIIGAQKAGTTSLYFYLKQHPQIYMSHLKEPEFFTYEGEHLDNSKPTIVTKIEDYCNLFQGVPEGIVTGEASPSYIYSPQAPARIKYYIPKVKIIAILRHPAERAYSNFLHCLQRGTEPLQDFAQALQAEKARINSNWGYRWHYQCKGFYYTQLKRYFDKFDHNQIQVYLHEELIAKPLIVIKHIFSFLDVDENFMPDISRRYNVSGIPKNKFLGALDTNLSPVPPAIKQLVPSKVRYYIKSKMYDKPPPLSPQLRQNLIDVYRHDILQLQDLIQRDLSSWLK